jgi:predicted nucleotidyltransferase component of viral defense system
VKNDGLNVAQSVLQRLLNLARKTGQDYNRLLVRYGSERILYRLSRSSHADRFVLKGAMLFAVWSGHPYRATQDIDLLGFGASSPEELARAFREIAATGVPEEDGMMYSAETVKASVIREDMKYEGVRIRMEGRLGNARIPLTIDVGFGDAVTPAPQTADLPVLLDGPKPALRSYPRETVIGEKFEAMVSLGENNSRMKDFADIWFLARHFDFDGELLVRAIAATFERRQTEMQAEPLALTQAFAEIQAKQTQWKAFLRRTSVEELPADLSRVVADIGAFLLPALKSLAARGSFLQTWTAPGPWRHEVAGQDTE